VSDPRARLGTLFCLGVLVLCLEGAFPLGTLAGLTTLLALAHPRAAGWRLRFLGGVALLAWSTALSQGLFWSEWPRTPVVVLCRSPAVVLWREGLVHGLVQSFRFVALAAAGLWVAVATSPDRIVTGLLALRVPYGVALMGATALRFVPLVGEELVAVRRARARRGRPVWQRGLGAWVRLEAAMLRPVVARALRRARALAESLETRGFHPTAPRAVREPLHFGGLDTVGLGAAVVVSTAAFVARALYVLYGSELYYTPGLRGLYAFVRAWM
jgi:energy-coupling factor transport system permease protein